MLGREPHIARDNTAAKAVAQTDYEWRIKEALE
jgi:hypothetical protein